MPKFYRSKRNRHEYTRVTVTLTRACYEFFKQRDYVDMTAHMRAAANYYAVKVLELEKPRIRKAGKRG